MHFFSEGLIALELMAGMTGIDLALLSLVPPERTPSVLTLS